jgi:DDE family transposase
MERAMHAGSIVARVLGPCLDGLHAKRAATCQRAVVAVVLGAALSLSGIALGVRSATGYRHRIKSVDRLLGNTALHAVRGSLYAALARRWLTGVRQLLLVIDWSDLTPDQSWHWLRASVAVEGRSVTLYEEVHPQRRLGNPKVQQQFLARVAESLPAGCEPIVMTDAGFRATWFKAVAARGWAFVGRVRGRELVRSDSGVWIRATSLYAQATEQPRDLGRHTYVRSNPLEARLVLAKRLARGRHCLNIHGHRRAANSSLKCARAAQEPWLLAASMRLQHLTAASIVRLYAQRMRIEQSFRDTKNLRYGQGLRITRSRTRERLQMLLLIGHLAAFVQRLIGEHAKAHQLQLNFMATSRKTRPEISVLTLARRILLSVAPSDWLDRLSPWAAIPPLRAQAIDACTPA